jgi:hypothetical protein
VARVLDLIACLLVVGGGLSFACGVQALGERKDLVAVYLLLVGALCLKAATDLLRPKAGDA